MTEQTMSGIAHVQTGIEIVDRLNRLKNQNLLREHEEIVGEANARQSLLLGVIILIWIEEDNQRKAPTLLSLLTRKEVSNDSTQILSAIANGLEYLEDHLGHPKNLLEKYYTRLKKLS